MKQFTIYNPAGLHGPMISAAFLGDKAASLQPGEEIQLVGPGGQELIYAEMLDIWIGPLSAAPAILLEKSHDPLQRNFTGLHLHLLSRYAGEGKGLDQATPISILVMRPKESTLIRPTNRQIDNLG